MSEGDAAIGISSYNSRETISSCRLWRRKVTNAAAASSFRTSGSLSAACSAIRRRATHLIRQLGLQVERKHSKSETSVTQEEFAAFHELVRLVGNATFFDVFCRLTVKDAGIIQQLGTILEFTELQLDAAASVIRLFGNLCECKEGAAAVLQTKPCVRVIVQWSTKNVEKELECATKTSPSTATQNEKEAASASKGVNWGKVREQCIRTLRNAASCGKNFAQYLLRADAIYAVARCIRLFYLDKTAPPPKNILASAFQFLQQLLPCKDHNFSQQILRADISEILMELVRDSNSTDSNKNAAVPKVVLGMITHYSSLRVDLSKYDATQWAKARVEECLAGDEWPEDASARSADYLIALVRFCRDAYTRTKLRENGGLDLLLKIFIVGKLKDAKLFNELMSAFLCFLYEDQGLKYLVEYEGFLLSVVRIIDRFATDFPCNLHCAEEKDGKGETNSTEALGAAVCEFRADSPSYKRFRVDPDAVNGADESKLFETPLCKDFTNAALSVSSWPSPSGTSPRSVASPSSPGPSWSPSASSLNSFSSVGSTSPPYAGNASGASSCWSLALDSCHGTDDLEYDWCQRHANFSQEQSPQAVCDCVLSTEDTPSHQDQERALCASIKLLSWLSHGVHASLLVNGNYLDILLSYVAGVCRPEPRVGRLIERLIRNRLFTETLLALEFHRKVTEALCRAKCGGAKSTWCVKCRKLCKIGCGLIGSFRAQVDTDFGFGTIEHMMALGDEKMRLKCICAMLYLMKSNWRVKCHMVGEQGGLTSLMTVLTSNEGDEEARISVLKALYAAVGKDVLLVPFSETSSLETSPNTCKFVQSDKPSDERCVTFLEKDGDRSIDCNVDTLVASSPFYRAMFSGSYSESSQRRFVYDEADTMSTFSAFLFYIHYLHGCRGCDRAPLNSASDCLSALELADKRLCPSMGEYVVNKVAKYMERENIEEFVSSAVLRNDFALFKLCLDFLFSLDNPDTFMRVLTTFRSSEILPEFSQMLHNYLKSQCRFE